jgi:gluconate 2-dehydrogenase alpha chain
VARQLPKTDVVIVGMGASGAIAAMVLAKAGLQVVGIEAGDRLTQQDQRLDELIESHHYNYFGRHKTNLEVPTWRPNAATPTRIATAMRSSPMMNAVGGSTLHYGTQSWRLPAWNFRSRTETIRRYGAGALPAGSALADWPLGYDELEPYYDQVEWAIGVSGQAGNLQGKKIAGGNPFESPRSRDFPLPPLRRAGYLDFLGDAAKRLGWHPFPGPSAAHSMPFEGKPPCTYCGFCATGCFISAKGSTDLHVIPAAEATNHLSIVTLARVTKVASRSDGRVTGVHYVRNGEEFFQPASAVMLATYTYENTRLLLLSKSDAYPRGCSNNHGQVGKYYMCHVAPSAWGLFPGMKMNRWSGLAAQSVQVDDWDADNYDHTGLGFIGGGTLQGMMELKPIMAANTPPPPGVPSWGSGWKSWLAANVNSVGSVSGQVEMLAHQENFLDLDPEARDAFGTPVLRITFDLKEDYLRAYAFTQARLVEWLKEAGASQTWTAPARPAGLANHAYGGTRMGTDRATSVVDGWSFSHEAANLAILGGSTFPTTGGHNPTQTLQALAWRCADRLLRDWNTIAV